MPAKRSGSGTSRRLPKVRGTGWTSFLVFRDEKTNEILASLQDEKDRGCVEDSEGGEGIPGQESGKKDTVMARVSREAGKMWATLPLAVRDQYTAEAKRRNEENLKRALPPVAREAASSPLFDHSVDLEHTSWTSSDTSTTSSGFTSLASTPGPSTPLSSYFSLDQSRVKRGPYPAIHARPVMDSRDTLANRQIADYPRGPFYYPIHPRPHPYERLITQRDHAPYSTLRTRSAHGMHMPSASLLTIPYSIPSGQSPMFFGRAPPNQPTVGPTYHSQSAGPLRPSFALPPNATTLPGLDRHMHASWSPASAPAATAWPSYHPAFMPPELCAPQATLSVNDPPLAGYVSLLRDGDIGHMGPNATLAASSYTVKVDQASSSSGKTSRSSRFDFETQSGGHACQWPLEEGPAPSSWKLPSGMGRSELPANLPPVPFDYDTVSSLDSANETMPPWFPPSLSGSPLLLNKAPIPQQEALLPCSVPFSPPSSSQTAQGLSDAALAQVAARAADDSLAPSTSSDVLHVRQDPASDTEITASQTVTAGTFELNSDVDWKDFFDNFLSGSESQLLADYADADAQASIIDGQIAFDG
ncbi:hypothetical protein C8Q79DRAFT_1013404 [Trametes meyenii]|nr:hypothetical protein C8Q79DRAFT_1013404 [Trametes meyenii]